MPSPHPPPSHSSTALPSIESGGDVRRLLHTLIHRHCVFSGMHTCAARMERSVQMLTSEQMAAMGISEEPSGQFLLEWFTIYNELSNFRGSQSSLDEKLADTARKISSQHGMRAPPPPPPKARLPLQKGLKRKAPEPDTSAPEETPQMARRRLWKKLLPRPADSSWDVQNISNELSCRIDEYHLRLMILEQHHCQILHEEKTAKIEEMPKSAASSREHSSIQQDRKMGPG